MGEWKLNASSIFTTIMAAVLGALLSWVVRLDERVFDLNAHAATKEDVRVLENKIDSKLDYLITKIDKLRSDIDRNVISRRDHGGP